MTDTDDDNWGWVRGATNYRKPADLIRNLIDCTSKGGNFVLNVGPMASGEFPPEHMAILEVMGKWTAVNGEAIYGTVPAPECATTVTDDFKSYSTKKARSIYLHVVKWPASGELTVRVGRKDLAGVKLLDKSLPRVQFTSAVDKDATVLTIKQPAKVDPYATVLKLTFKGKVTE
jgi:alpha-L-fucosidase